jgi:hypothetical protein
LGIDIQFAAELVTSLHAALSGRMLWMFPIDIIVFRGFYFSISSKLVLAGQAGKSKFQESAVRSYG